MGFLKQYIKIINYSLIGLTFAFSSFYLLSNAYHYLEIRKDFVVDFSSQTLVTDIDNKMKNVSKNISGFNSSTYRGNIPTNQMIIIQQRLNGCISSFNNTTFNELKQKKVVNIKDVYMLRESYEDDILSDCIVTNLYWTTAVNNETLNSSYLVDNQKMMQMYVEYLLNATSYVKKDLLNNSSYYFNTAVASAVKNNTKDGFYEVIGTYNKAASFVEFVSEWFKNEVEGNYDQNN